MRPDWRRLRDLLGPSAVFAVFVLAISYRVTPNHGTLMYGDYPYYWPGRAFNGLSAVQASFLGYIRLVGLQAVPLLEAPRLLTVLLPDAWAAYLLTYGLVFATCLTYFLVVRRLTGNVIAAYVAGFFIILNHTVFEYLVVQPSHIFVALIVYALTFYVVETSGDRVSGHRIVLLGLLSFAITHPLLWFLDLLLLTGLFAYRRYQGQRAVSAAVRSIGLSVLLAGYWLVPFAAGSLSARTEDLYAGNQSSVFEGVRDKIHHVQAFALFQYPGSRDKAFIVGTLANVLSFAALVFVVAVFFLRARHGPLRRPFLLLLGLFVVSMSLGLGPNSAVTGRLWLLAYNHVPSFGFFRTFSRFLNLALVALVLLVAFALEQLRLDRLRAFRFVAAGFLVMTAASQLVFFTGDLSGTISAAKPPYDYTLLNKALSGPADYSVITYPNMQYEAYRWAANPNQRAFQQIVYFKEFFLGKSVLFNRAALNDLNISNAYFPRLFAYDNTFAFYPGFDDDLNELDVKYVLVHKDLFDIGRSTAAAMTGTKADALVAGSVPFARYLQYFDGAPRYRRVLDTPSFTLYENLAYSPRVRGERLSYQRVSDTTYRVHVSQLDTARAVTLLQRFDVGWKAYLLPATDGAWCREPSGFPGGLVQCADDSGGGRRWAGGLSLRRALHAPHDTDLGYANRWTLDPVKLRRAVPKRFYSANPDGSINVDLMLYFEPQKTVWAGFSVTGAVLFGLVAWGLWMFWSRRQRSVARRSSGKREVDGPGGEMRSGTSSHVVDGRQSGSAGEEEVRFTKKAIREPRV